MDKEKKVFKEEFKNMEIKERSGQGKLAIFLVGFKEEQMAANSFREHRINSMFYYRWQNKFLEASRKDFPLKVRIYDDKVLMV